MNEDLTLQEAKRILKVNMDGWTSSPLVKVDDILVKANDMALRSLDAWEEIRKEIKRQAESINNMTDKWYGGQLAAFGYVLTPY